jgi:2-C-methyl-D-erythritol 4-phosphate cytidylyltransferase
MNRVDACHSGPAVAAIICAAGASSRIGGLKKEYRPLPGSVLPCRNLTVLGAAVSAFASVPEIRDIVITVPPDPQNNETSAKKALPPELLAENADAKIHFVSGGSTRRASVFNALLLLSEKVFGNGGMPPSGFVLIHDGARPWVSVSLIGRIIDGVKKYRAVIPLQPLVETPKETDLPLDGGGPVYIKRHLKRAFTGGAQTPQGFVYPEILIAHKQAAVQDDIEYTDDAEVWAAFYGPVAAIPGESENRKITFAEDFVC